MSVKDEALVPYNHSCKRCGKCKGEVNFHVFEREYYKPYVRKVCNICRRAKDKDKIRFNIKDNIENYFKKVETNERV